MAKSRARKLADLIVGAGIDIDGNLTFDGGSVSADLTFGDNDKANFGDASDLQIYHDGSSNLIQGSNGSLYIQAKAGENSILATPDGGVNIYHDNSLKFETTAAGATLTGALTATNNISGLNLVATTATYSPIIYGGSSSLQLKSNTAEMFAQFVNNGAAELYYDNNKRVETTSTGVDISGSLSSGVITTEGASGGKNLVYASNFAASGASIQITLERTSNSTGWGGIGADDTYCFAAWGGSGGVVQRFGIGQSGNANLLYGGYQINSTTVIDSSRNLTNIGTVSASGGVEVSASSNLIKHDYNDLGTYVQQIRSYNDRALILSTKSQDNNNYISFETQDTERMRIDYAGNVGIGGTTITDVNLLNLQGSSVTKNIGIVFNDTNTSKIFSIQNGGSALKFFDYTASQERMRIDTSGNVGIGTASPTSKLTVNTGASGNTATFSSGTSTSGDYSGITLHAYSISGVEWYGSEIRSTLTASNPNYNNPRLGFFTQDHDTYLPADRTEKMSILSNGNVGIGTTSPSEKLTVAGPIGVSATGYTANATTANFGLYTSGLVDTTYIQMPASGQFQVWKPSTGAVVTVLESGNVGIGTDSPATKLHVSAGTTNANIIARLEQGTTAGNYSAIEVGRTDGSGNVQLTPAVTGGVPIAGIPGILLGSTNAALPAVAIQTPSSSSGHIVFNPKGTEKVRITADGNVGIGTTSPAAPLEVHSNAGLPIIRARYNDSGYYTDYNSNGITFNGSGQNFDFSDNGSSVLYLKSGGNVGIGTTSPNAKLEIKGASSTNYLQFNNSSDSEIFRIDSNFRWGWGTTTPSAVVHITGQSTAGLIVENGAGIASTQPYVSMAANNYSTGFGTFRWEDQRASQPSPSFIWEVRDGDGTVLAYDFRTGATGAAGSKLAITQSGTVGIGTNSPKGRFEVAGGGGATGVQSYFSTNAGYTDPVAGNASHPGGAKIILWNDTSTPQKASIGMSGTADIWFNNAGGQNGAGFTFYTGNGASATPVARLKITKDGKVGIGTTSPNKKLHLSLGSSGASNYGVDGLAIEGPGNVGIQFMGGASNQQGLTFSDSGATEAGYLYYNHASNSLLLKAESSILFNSGGANEKMRLDSSGNLLIGTDVAAAKLYAYTGTGGTITKFEGPAGRYVYSGTDSGGYYMEVAGTQASERVLRLQGNNGSNTYTQLFIDAGAEKIYTSSNAKVGIGTTDPTESLTVIGAICSKIGDGDLATLTTNNHATNVGGGTLEFTTSYSGTLAAGRVFTFTYEATSWKSWMFEIEVASTHGFTTIKAGGYNNSSNSKNIYEVGDAQSGGTLTHTNNGQHNVFTYTLNAQMIHPTFKIKYTQGGGDGAPTMERMKLVIT